MKYLVIFIGSTFLLLGCATEMKPKVSMPTPSTYSVPQSFEAPGQQTVAVPVGIRRTEGGVLIDFVVVGPRSNELAKGFARQMSIRSDPMHRIELICATGAPVNLDPLQPPSHQTRPVSWALPFEPQKLADDAYLVVTAFQTDTPIGVGSYSLKSLPGWSEDPVLSSMVLPADFVARSFDVR